MAGVCPSQGLKSIGNAGTAFPGRHTTDRKKGPFTMKNQELKCYIKPKKGEIIKYTAIVLFLP
jgi:hypothetical protein